MNKFAVIVALSAVLVGLVAISSVSGNHVKRFQKGEHQEPEGRVEKSHHHPQHQQEVRGRHGKVNHPAVHHAHQRRVKPVHHRHQHRRPYQPTRNSYPVCSGAQEGGRGAQEGGRGGQEGARGGQEGAREDQENEFEQGGEAEQGNEFEQGSRGSQEQSGESREGSQGGEFEQGSDSEQSGEADQGSEFEQGNRGNQEFGRGAQEFGRGSQEGARSGQEFGRGNQEGGRRRGSFQGVAGFGGFRKTNELDAGVRADAKQRNRNQFQRNKGVFAGEQKNFNAGASSGDNNSVEGFRRHKNVNNDRLVVKETNRGNDDTDAFRKQNSHNQEGHVGASDNKFFGAHAGESGNSEQENEKDFEADVQKKNTAEGFGGVGAVKGQF